MEIWVKPSDNGWYHLVIKGFGQLLVVGETDLVMVMDKNYNIALNIQNQKINFFVNKDDINQDDSNNHKREP